MPRLDRRSQPETRATFAKIEHGARRIHHHFERGDTEQFQLGMSFTIEPMLLSGGTAFTQAADGWTEHIDDNMPSAQFEHTVVVTEAGAEILTITSDGVGATTSLT